jgi:hypothetical protein
MDYRLLRHKPQINSVELDGDKSASDLGLASQAAVDSDVQRLDDGLDGLEAALSGAVGSINTALDSLAGDTVLALGGKLDKNQGASNGGRMLGIDGTGAVVPVDAPDAPYGMGMTAEDLSPAPFDAVYIDKSGVYQYLGQPRVGTWVSDDNGRLGVITWDNLTSWMVTTVAAATPGSALLLADGIALADNVGGEVNVPYSGIEDALNGGGVGSLAVDRDGRLGIVVSDLGNAYAVATLTPGRYSKAEADALLGGKVSVLPPNNVASAYVIEPDGSHALVQTTTSATPGCIPMVDSAQGITVGLTPTQPGHAASKQYVDGRAGAMIPDYSRMESTNRISANNGTWTADRDGYVNCEFYIGTTGTAGTNMYVQVNSKAVYADHIANAFQRNRACVPVKKGNVVRMYSDVAMGTGGTYSCFFIPPLWLMPDNSLINFPNQWVPGTEYDFGNGLYGKRVTGTVTRPANERDYKSITTGASNVIAFGGIWRGGGAQASARPIGMPVVLETGPAAYYSELRLFYDGGIGIYTTSPNARDGSNDARYDLWVKYTK